MSTSLSDSERQMESLRNSSNAATIGSESSRPNSSARVFEGSRVASSRPPSRSLSGTTSTHFSGLCPICQHRHHKRQQRLLESRSHTGIFCENCNYKIIGLGGDSRQGSLTIQEQTRSHSTIAATRAAVCCDHPVDGEPSPKRVESELLPTVVESGGDSDSSRLEQRNDVERVASNYATASGTPSATTYFRESHRPRDFEDRKRHKIIKRLYRHYGYDIHLERRRSDAQPSARTLRRRGFLSIVKRLFSARTSQTLVAAKSGEVDPRASGECKRQDDLPVQKDEHGPGIQTTEAQNEGSGRNHSTTRQQAGQSTSSPDVAHGLICMCSTECPCRRRHATLPEDLWSGLAEVSNDEGDSFLARAITIGTPHDFAAMGAAFQPEARVRRDSVNSGYSEPRALDRAQREQSPPRSPTAISSQSPPAESSQARHEASRNTSERAADEGHMPGPSDQLASGSAAADEETFVEEPSRGQSRGNESFGGRENNELDHTGIRLFGQATDSDVSPRG